jgi:hypothetical protein
LNKFINLTGVNLAARSGHLHWPAGYEKALCDKGRPPMKTVALLLTLVSFTGCSAMQPTNQTITFDCSEPDAYVLVNGDRFSCPGSTEVRRNKNMTIEAHKAGYDTYRKTVATHHSTTYYLDLIGTITWFLPVIGLFSPGKRELDQTKFDIKLYPSEKS